jgi:F-type H+-transporting ATPase subunit gamma
LASLKEIKSRIASIRNTQKITSAMRMVSSAKLHHVQGMTEAFLRYKDELEKIVNTLSHHGEGVQATSSQTTNHPDSAPHDGGDVRQDREGQRSLLLIPISSNSGLCGAFNSNMVKATFQRIKEWEAQGAQVQVLPIGKKIAHALKKEGINFKEDFVNLLETVEKSNTFAKVSSLVELAVERYQAKEIDHVEFIYHHFKSMGTQLIQVDSLQLTTHLSPSTAKFSLLTEPSPEELLASLFPRLQNAQVYSILLDSLTSEHAARMLAMQTADDNANDLLKELTLLYNKTRQQAITDELIDIMGGKVVNQ